MMTVFNNWLINVIKMYEFALRSPQEWLITPLVSQRRGHFLLSCLKTRAGGRNGRRGDRGNKLIS